MKKILFIAIMVLSMVVGGGTAVTAEANQAALHPAPNITQIDPNVDYPATINFGIAPGNCQGKVCARSFSTAATGSSAITLEGKYVQGLGNIWEVWGEAKTVSKSKLYSVSAQASLYKKGNRSWSLVGIGPVNRGSAFWDFDKTAFSEIRVYHPYGKSGEFKANGAHSVAYGRNIYHAYTDYIRSI